ncbi:MAG: DNA topoisomerase 1 [Candidatus Methanoperedenaceae archaeon GB50]|nr:MAG: DNA topoisomerase 1 [Candidatus Methanoperedenaceae archaeon GB50]
MHLIITEKHDAAKRISTILAGKKPKHERVGGVDTYSFDGVVVMGLSGHIVGLDFASEYNNWQKCDVVDLIRAEIVTKPTQKKIVSALRKLGKAADRVTIATDYDREGELIGVEALRIIQEVNRDVPVDRVRYSSITPKEIKETFSDPKKVDFSLASAGESRQVIDLIWGAALTRFVSLASGRLGKNFLSVGRVQSPTLALIVDRERKREAFVSKPYWELEAHFREGFVAHHAHGRFWSEEEVESVRAKLGERGVVKNVEVARRVERPPIPFNTTEFLRAASRIGITPANAMRIAESLYVNGFISYPRTDNTVYPEAMNAGEIISLFLKSEFSEDAEALLKTSLTPTRGKKETTDHPPIHPASLATRPKLKEDEWKIYELVVRRFFATFGGDAVWETIKLAIDIDREEFRARGARLIEPGWRWHYPYKQPEDRILPKLEVGEEVHLSKIEVLSKETQPPTRYGQGRLIKMMEELGLGTKSTRHETIGKLYSRGYVHGNPIQPTKTAISLIDSLQKYVKRITEPEMTRKLEEDMDLIAEGKISEEKVVEEARSLLESAFKDLTENKEKITEILREGLREDKILGRCPECGNNLTVRRSKRGGRFVGCTGYPDCTFSLPLPKTGQIIITDKKCEKHNLHNIKIINKTRNKRPWDLGCPQCNFEEWQKREEAK